MAPQKTHRVFFQASICDALAATYATLAASNEKTTRFTSFGRFVVDQLESMPADVANAAMRDITARIFEVMPMPGDREC